MKEFQLSLYDAQDDRFKVMADIRRGTHLLKALGYQGWQGQGVLATWQPLAKGERQASPFRSAAFVGTDGVTYETGTHHDIEALPPGVEVSAEGFVDVDGHFLTRDEAAQVMHLDHQAHSEELELKKGENNQLNDFNSQADAFIAKKGNSLSKLNRDDIKSRLRDHQDTLEALMLKDGQHPAFQVAARMAGHPADAELRRQAELDYGDDIVAVALASHGLDPEDESLRMSIEAACLANGLRKSEFNVAVLPRMVTAGQTGAEHMVTVIRQAYASNLVYDVRLGGRHSAGTAVAYDQQADRFWLLKPGGASPSPASGVKDSNYSQSRREAVFAQACRAYEPMRQFYPETWLLLLDGHEVACIEVAGAGYLSAQKYGDAAELLKPYQDNVDIYRWAWFDMVLGNPDNHGGNVLLTEDGRVALIDHGSALAGPGFNPPGDPRKSFIPYYLRVFRAIDYKTATPEQRYNGFPHPTPDEADVFRAWVEGLGNRWQAPLEELMPEVLAACRARADIISSADDPVDYLLKAWAGLEPIIK